MKERERERGEDDLTPLYCYYWLIDYDRVLEVVNQSINESDVVLTLDFTFLG